MKTCYSYLLICTLVTIGVKAQTPFNGGFEDWGTTTPLTNENPENWMTNNLLSQSLGLPPNVILTEDACSGSFAMRMETGIDGEGMPISAVAGMKNAVQGRPERLTGCYKADFKGDDYAEVQVTLLSDRGIVGRGFIDIGYSSFNFIYFELPIEYISNTIKPDSFIITIYSSVDRPVAGSWIILDDLQFEENIDVTIPLRENFVTRVWPNPATDEIRFEVPRALGEMWVRIFDAGGTILEKEIFENQIQIDVSRFAADIYYYEIRYENNELYDHGQFKVTRHGQ